MPARPVPPLPQQCGQTFPRLVSIMQRLLADGGCPWDRQQSFASLRRYVIEEAHEVVDAIDSQDRHALREELGDLLFQVVFQAELGRAEGSFGPDDVIAGICDKLERRHPHVFGDAVASTPEQVRRSWDRIKAEEKTRRGRTDGLLDSVPVSLPALARAQRIGERVEKVGFDWPDTAGSRAKVDEELGELDAAIRSNDRTALEEEIGDVLFALVNLARHVGIDAESALGATTAKFIRRFRHVEQRVRERHGGFAPSSGASTRLPLHVLDTYWEEAKAIERGEHERG
jgi:MazG family protein